MQNPSFTFTNRSVKSLGTLQDHFEVTIDTQLVRYAELNELRDRARLIEYSNDKMKNDSEEEIANLRLFVSLVDLIEIILERLESLYISGHPYVADYSSTPKIFQAVAKDNKGLNEFSRKIENFFDKWEKHLCEMYEKYLDLTYFSFQQVWLIEHYLYNQNSRSRNDASYHLLKFIGIQPESIKVQNSLEQNKNMYERLKRIGESLTIHRRQQNPKSNEGILSSKRVILVQTSEEGIMRAIMSCFHLAKIQAKANQLFYCAEKTTWMEMRAFIYRCFYSQTLHQLIRPELLTPLIQGQFIQLLRSLMKTHPEQCFQLGIITTGSIIHMQLINGLKTLDIVHTYHDQDLFNPSELKNAVKNYIGDNIILVTSHIAGLGKSTFIRDAISQMNKQYIKFPINGDVHVDILAERLASCGDQLASSTSAIHLDIGTVDNIRHLNEFLYCLLLFRNFRLGQVAVHVPNDVPIYIELDASPNMINLNEKIPILKYLNTTNIDCTNWKELKPENLPGIQWVVNYLQSIDNRTINKTDIHETTLQCLDNNTCSQLLAKYVLEGKNSEFVTWTKVSIFVAIYSSLFSGFSRCGHFLVKSVQWSGTPQLRLDILLSLLKSSDQFTSLSVEAVRKNQRSANDSGPIDFSEAIIRWDKSQAFTLVFTATDDPVFVYKKAQDIPKSLLTVFNSRPRSTLRISNVRQLSQSSLLSDYTKLTHEQFFAKLASLSRKYFNKSICLKCFSQHAYEDQQCQKCLTNETLVRSQSWGDEHIAAFQKMIAKKLQDEYVLTPDNYIKMLLIYLRVRSGLPVLIMGETGELCS
jgi:ribosomal protein L40E